MRFGLVGTGHWARVTHAPALASAEGSSLVSVWGRDLRRAEAVASEYGASAYTDYERFLDDVDAVTFSVPPDVQAARATEAAAAGKHLLLEKPIALDAATAAALEKAVHDAGVASVVFFTQLYRPEVRVWLDACAAADESWEGGRALLLGSVAREPGPFTTPWRLEHGALWDVGPHALAALVSVLGPVESVTAHRDRRESVHLLAEHAGGASSVTTVSLSAPAAAGTSRVEVWGGSGLSEIPSSSASAAETLGVAVRELVASAAADIPAHPYDVTFGRAIVDTLDQAARLVGRAAPVP